MAFVAHRVRADFLIDAFSSAGPVFVLILRNAYPINLLNVVQNIPEVCSIFCATANPVEVIVARTEQGSGVMGVIDGSPPKGVKGPAEIAARKEFNWWRWHRHLRFANGVLKDLGEPLCLPGALPA